MRRAALVAAAVAAAAAAAAAAALAEATSLPPESPRGLVPRESQCEGRNHLAVTL